MVIDLCKDKYNVFSINCCIHLSMPAVKHMQVKFKEKMHVGVQQLLDTAVSD